MWRYLSEAWLRIVDIYLSWWILYISVIDKIEILLYSLKSKVPYYSAWQLSAHSIPLLSLYPLRNRHSWRISPFVSRLACDYFVCAVRWPRMTRLWRWGWPLKSECRAPWSLGFCFGVLVFYRGGKSIVLYVGLLYISKSLASRFFLASYYPTDVIAWIHVETRHTNQILTLWEESLILFTKNNLGRHFPIRCPMLHVLHALENKDVRVRRSRLLQAGNRHCRWCRFGSWRSIRQW